MGERTTWGAGRTRAAFRDGAARPSAGVAFSGTAGPRPWRRRTLLRLMPVTGRRTVAARSSTCPARAGASTRSRVGARQPALRASRDDRCLEHVYVTPDTLLRSLHA